jgi:hypothetical protein
MDYHILFYGGMAGALVALILAVYLYIKLNIPQVVKDLTGISLPGAARIASARKFAEAEQTGRITNEIKLRKDVDVSRAERTLTMENQQKNTSTQNLGQGSAAITRPSAIQQAAALAPTDLLFPVDKKEAGDTVLLEHAGGPERNEAEETALLQESQAGQTQPAAPHVEETALLEPAAETELLASGGAQLQHVEETALLDDSGQAGHNVETALLQETALLNDTSPHHEPAETALLSDIEETTLLTPAAALEEEQGLYFKKEVDIIVVHTTTII